MAEVKAKVQKAVLYKMISYKGIQDKNNSYTPLTAAARLPKTEKSIQRGMTGVMMGLNALGRTLNSIALNTQFMLESWKDNIRQGIKDNSALLKQEDKTKKLEVTRKKKKDTLTEKRRKLEKREKQEEDDEKKKPLGQSVVEGAKKTGKGLFSGFLGLLGNLVGTFIAIPILTWIGKNPDSVQKLMGIFQAIGKFVFNIVSFLGGLSLDGIIDFLENPISLKGLFGVVKFLLGAVPLFAGLVFLKNPDLLLKTAGKVIGGLLGGLKRMFGINSKADKLKQFKLKKLGGQRGNFFSSKAGKIGLGLGAGFATGAAISAAGGTEAEAIGGGVGAAGGQMAGAALGAATGIPGMGVVGGMVGTVAGGAVGKAIGPLIEPIIGPLKEWFSMVGKVFNDVLADIKEPLEEFFTTLGNFMSQILKVVEPHLPMISKIIGVGLQVMFAPLFLGIRALTAVLKLFTSGTGDKKGGEEKKGKADGGLVYRARGGWISGPQSGYPVSLDGGNNVSFIGHGTEWVGMNKSGGGNAYVIPYDTPATKTNKNLTSRRYTEADKGGYVIPTATDHKLRPYAMGGKWFKKQVNKVKDRFTDDKGKPKGIMRWIAGAADQATGGFFDFDKQGHSLYQASGIVKKTGDIIDNARQKKQEERYKKLKTSIEEGNNIVNIDAGNGEAINLGSADATTDVPIMIPGDDEMAADRYLRPKYGLVAEFLTDPVEFM